MSSPRKLIEELTFWAAAVPEIIVVRTPKSLSGKIRSPLLAYLTVRNGGTTGDGSTRPPFFVVPVREASVAALLADACVLRRPLLNQTLGYTMTKKDKEKLRSADEAVVREAVPLLRLDAFSGTVRFVNSDETPLWEELYDACLPPTLMSTEEERAAIRKHAKTFDEGLLRTLDGTLIVQEPGTAVWRQVSPDDAEGVLNWLDRVSYTVANYADCVIRDLLPLLGPERTAAALEYAEDRIPDFGEAWRWWGHEIFQKESGALITVTAPDDQPADYTAEDAEIFGEVWDRALQDAAEEDGFILVTKRVPTGMRDAKTGEVIRKISGFTITAEGVQPLSGTMLRHSFHIDPHSGKPLASDEALVFRDFPALPEDTQSPAP